MKFDQIIATHSLEQLLTLKIVRNNAQITAIVRPGTDGNPAIHMDVGMTTAEDWEVVPNATQ